MVRPIRLLEIKGGEELQVRKRIKCVYYIKIEYIVSTYKPRPSCYTIDVEFIHCDTGT